MRFFQLSGKLPCLKTRLSRLKVNRENRTIILQGILAFLFIGLALYFVKHERTELREVKHSIQSASPIFVIVGLLLAVFFIVVQGWMYQASFKSVGENIGLRNAMSLFVKRNFISIFLPAGGISSLAFFTDKLEKQQISKTKIHMASTIYATLGIVSVVVVAIPILVFATFRNALSSNDVLVFAGTLFLGVVLFLMGKSIWQKGWAYLFMLKIWPRFEEQFNELKAIQFHSKQIIYALLFSVLIEGIGILHLIISMHALGYNISIEGASMAYIVSVMFLIISPFLRGIGAIELSLAFILTRYGFSNIEAISVTFLYRFFEFWILLLIGLMSFLFVRNNILLRITPVFLTFVLGVVNIVSVLTPAIRGRMKLLTDFLPLYAIDLSNYAIFIIGVFLLLISAFLLKGVRSAWYLALFLAIASVIGNLTKAIDYEEASLAMFTVAALFFTRKQYFIRNNPALVYVGINTAFFSILAVLIYGIIGFYFLDKKHFNLDFSMWESVKYTIQNYFFYQSSDLEIQSRFARNFLYSIRITGGLTMVFLLYTVVKPYLLENKTDEQAKSLALELLKKYGKSQLDYFKLYFDKLLFFSADREAFISYRIAGLYAVVLEDPVCADSQRMTDIIREFDQYCIANGMKSCFYRVPETSVSTYEKLGKKSLLIGQEGILNLATWSIQGKDKKSIRTSSNKQKELGLVAKVYSPPINEGLLQQLHSVSNEWQTERNYDELVFSQGIFDFHELKNQSVMVVENQEGKIMAFANIIPDYAPGEATFDLIRNAKDSPNGLIEFLMAELFFYFQQQGYKSANLGFVAMSGIENGKSVAEKSIKYAYEKLRAFAHFKGLKDFKAKFGLQWENKYLIYSHDYDLFSIPQALRKVTKQ